MSVSLPAIDNWLAKSWLARGWLARDSPVMSKPGLGNSRTYEFDTAGVINLRWREFSGGEAVLESHGRVYDEIAA